MTMSEALGAVVGAVFGGGDKQDDDDAPLAAEADEGGTIEVGGQAWPRRSDRRVEVLARTIALAEHEEDAKVARLRALVSEAAEARNARLQALRSIDKAVRAEVCRDIDREASAALQVAWPTYRSGGQIAEAAQVGAALAHAWQREMVELGGTNLGLTTAALVQVVWAGRGGTPSDGLLNACARAVEASRSGSVVALARALGDVEQLSAVPLS
jgi:hypothetical protein